MRAKRVATVGILLGSVALTILGARVALGAELMSEIRTRRIEVEPREPVRLYLNPEVAIPERLMSTALRPIPRIEAPRIVPLRIPRARIVPREIKKGDRLLTRGQLAPAASIYEQYLQKQSDPEVRVRLGVAKLRMGQVNEGVRTLNDGVDGVAKSGARPSFAVSTILGTLERDHQLHESVKIMRAKAGFGSRKDVVAAQAFTLRVDGKGVAGELAIAGRTTQRLRETEIATALKNSDATLIYGDPEVVVGHVDGETEPHEFIAKLAHDPRYAVYQVSLPSTSGGNYRPHEVLVTDSKAETARYEPLSSKKTPSNAPHRLLLVRSCDIDHDGNVSTLEEFLCASMVSGLGKDKRAQQAGKTP